MNWLSKSGEVGSRVESSRVEERCVTVRQRMRRCVAWKEGMEPTLNSAPPRWQQTQMDGTIPWVHCRVTLRAHNSLDADSLQLSHPRFQLLDFS